MLVKKKILVVGAGGLLGVQTVHSLLNNNAAIIAADINYQDMQNKFATHEIDITNPNLSCIQLNINDSQQMTDFFLDVNNLDGAVNCSYPRNKNYGRSFFDVDLADFNENLSLHLGSSFLLMQQCAALFLKNKRPFSLVNVASVYGVVPPQFSIYENTSMTMPIEYAAIKSAIIHMNKYVACYIKNSAFRINSVSPGGLIDKQPESFLQEYKKLTLGKGMLNVEDILGTILFLLSDSSKYINGQNIIVDDGFSL